jgi:hypothetical protein
VFTLSLFEDSFLLSLNPLHEEENNGIEKTVDGHRILLVREEQVLAHGSFLQLVVE